MRKYVSRCRHCGIFFLTDPRNAGRKDLRCIFGCADAHRKQESIKRSIEYYKTKEGKDKKKVLNRKRTDKNLPSPCSSKLNIKEIYKIGKDHIEIETLNYFSEIVSLIEGYKVGSFRILDMLKKKVRQHSMVKMKKVDYRINYINNQPP